MSEKNFKTFVCVEVSSKRVLIVRNTRYFSRRFQLTGVESFVLLTDEPIFLKQKPESLTYTPVEGFRQFKSKKVKSTTYPILKKKAENLYLIQMNMELVRRRIRSSLKLQDIDNFAKSPQEFNALYRLFSSERAMLLNRTAKFFNMFQKKIDQANSVTEITDIYQSYAKNYSFGSFSMQAFGPEGI